MKIKWYGHACFRIEGDDIRIVTDPYTPEVAGLDPMDEPADVVVMNGDASTTRALLGGGGPTQAPTARSSPATSSLFAGYGS